MSYFVVTMWGSLPPFAMLGCNSRLSWLENKMGKRRGKDGRKEGGGREGRRDKVRKGGGREGLASQEGVV